MIIQSRIWFVRLAVPLVLPRGAVCVTEEIYMKLIIFQNVKVQNLTQNQPLTITTELLNQLESYAKLHTQSKARHVLLLEFRIVPCCIIPWTLLTVLLVITVVQIQTRLPVPQLSLRTVL
jgi:hypothetical protein